MPVLVARCCRPLFEVSLYLCFGLLVGVCWQVFDGLASIPFLLLWDIPSIMNESLCPLLYNTDFYFFYIADEDFLAYSTGHRGPPSCAFGPTKLRIAWWEGYRRECKNFERLCQCPVT